MKRRGWDSNPRALADKRFSRPPRYDHFDTPARERVMGIEPKTFNLQWITGINYPGLSLSYDKSSYKYSSSAILSQKRQDIFMVRRDVYKRQARERLMSEEGIYHRGRRCTEPEAVFAQIKHNSAWNRFRLRGLEKVKTCLLYTSGNEARHSWKCG